MQCVSPQNVGWRLRKILLLLLCESSANVYITGKQIIIFDVLLNVTFVVVNHFQESVFTRR